MKNSNKKQDNTTTLVETDDYITTAYGSMYYYKCAACGYDEILNDDNFCPHCGRKVIDKNSYLYSITFIFFNLLLLYYKTYVRPSLLMLIMILPSSRILVKSRIFGV